MLAVDVALEASSDVMQASCMSAYFEQSALYSNGTPTAFPTVDWITHLEAQIVEFDREIPEQQLASAFDEFDEQRDGESSKAGPLPVPGLARGLPAGCASCLRRQCLAAPCVRAVCRHERHAGLRLRASRRG